MTLDHIVYYIDYNDVVLFVFFNNHNIWSVGYYKFFQVIDLFVVLTRKETKLNLNKDLL